MKMQRKSWRDLDPRQQRWIAIQGTIQTVLLGIAGIDLIRRPAAEVRGSKRWWALGLLVQPIGPLVYLLRGRRPS